MDASVTGKCHICKERKQVYLCDLCGHYFCIKCQNWFARGIAFIKELTGAPTPGCCGPDT